MTISQNNINTIISILAGDKPCVNGMQKKIDYIKQNIKNLYTEIMYALTFQKYSEEEAKSLWDEILVHKYEMSKKLFRNVGIRVAALDYLSNKKNISDSLRIIDDSELNKIMVFVNTDGLTGVYNHRCFQEHLDIAIQKNKGFAVIFLDLDNFKEFNDTYGHINGDIILRQISDNILKNKNQNSKIYRYGGDEFVLINIYREKNEAIELAEHIKELIASTLFYKEDLGKSPKITVSIGLAFYPDERMTKKDLIGLADMRLYKAKKTGKNRVIID